MKKRYLIPIIVFLLFLCLIALLNINVSTRLGTHYKVSKMTMPLYLKVLNFYVRHYNHKWLVKQITGHLDTREDKILRLFHWTYETIKHQPKSLPIIDSHPWDVYVRGYGCVDNIHDLFSTLCNYIGTDAFFTVLYNTDTEMMLSFVRMKRGWVAFDPYRGVYFENNTGGLATIEEIDEQDCHVVKLKQTDSISIASYEKYFDENLPNIIEEIGSDLTRANLQSPINRLKFQLQRWFSGDAPLLE